MSKVSQFQDLSSQGEMSKYVKRRPACPNPSDFNAHDRQLQLAKEGTAFRAWDNSKKWVKNSFESFARVFKSRSMVTIEYVWARKIWRGIELCQPLGHGQLCSVAKICQTLPKNMDASPRSTKSIELSSTRSPEEYSNEPWLIGIISQSLHYINDEVVSILFSFRSNLRSGKLVIVLQVYIVYIFNVTCCVFMLLDECKAWSVVDWLCFFQHVRQQRGLGSLFTEDWSCSETNEKLKDLGYTKRRFWKTLGSQMGFRAGSLLKTGSSGNRSTTHRIHYNYNPKV